MPFITEELFHKPSGARKKQLCFQSGLNYREEWNFKAEENEIDTIKDAVRGIRNVRAEMNVVPSKKV